MRMPVLWSAIKAAQHFPIRCTEHNVHNLALGLSSIVSRAPNERRFAYTHTGEILELCNGNIYIFPPTSLSHDRKYLINCLERVHRNGPEGTALTKRMAMLRYLCKNFVAKLDGVAPATVIYARPLRGTKEVVYYDGQ